MLHPFDLNSTVSSMDELSRLASGFMTKFETGLPLKQPLDVDFVLHQTPSELPGLVKECSSPIMVSKQNDPRPVIHLNGPKLMGIPVPAFQGWLDLELAAIFLERQKDLFKFNFEREILPSIDVSGSAKQFIRYIVFHLEELLKQISAVKLLLDMAHGLPLCTYYYTSISPSNEERDNYHNLVPHHWTRAIFICKKAKEHATVALLERQGIFAELESYWWTCHDYILPEDKRLMNELARISNGNSPMMFRKQLIALFETIKSGFLMRPPDIPTNPK